MLRPYLAIIKDSFRAAIASRVLVLMLVLIALFLAVLVPFRLTEELSWEVNRDAHLGERPDAAFNMLVENKENPRRPELAYIWEKLPEDVRTTLEEYHEYDQKKIAGELDEPDMEYEGFARLGLYNDFVDALNDLIMDPEFYSDELWAPEKLLSSEANKLATYGVDKLDTIQKRRLNRLIISQAFSGTILPPANSSARLTYLKDNWELGKTAGGKVVFHEGTSSWLPWILDKFVLSAGMLISILVTASVMPSMFEHGSLSLMLSKPIHRWALFVAKFMGACAFATLLSVFLFVGLWIILGFRISYWDQSLLYSIPIYVFVFAIYYSVSSFLGMYFKNTIIAIVGTILFWILCFGCGETYKSFDKFMYFSDAVVVANENGNIVQTDRVGISRFWYEEEKIWVPTLINEENYIAQSSIKFAMMIPFVPRVPFPQAMAPVYSSKYDAWIGAGRNMNDFQGLNPTLVYAELKDAYEFNPAGQMPANSLRMFRHPDGNIIIVTGLGDFHRLDKDPREVAKQVQKIEEAGVGPAKAGKKAKDKQDPKAGDKTKTNPNRSNSNRTQVPGVFADIGPDRPVDIRDQRAVDLNQTNGKIAIYRSRSIFLFHQDAKGEYVFEKKTDLDLDVDSAMSAWIVYQKNMIYVCLGNGQIITIDGETLETKKSYLPESRSAIFAISGSPNGRFLAVTYRNGNLWMLDQDDDERMKRIKVSRQGDVKTGTFDSESNLAVVTRTDMVTIYDPGSVSNLEQASPKGYVLKNIYYFGVKPLYQIFPKPGEFYKLVSHLASSRQTKTNQNLDLTTTLEPEKPWEPFKSGLVFMLVMVALSCLVFVRTDY